MMKQEFEALAGYEISTEDYNNIIEPMYMATNMSKADFVKCIDKKRFALKPLKSIVREMKKCAESLEDTCTHYIDSETKEKLENLVREYINRKYSPLTKLTFHIEDAMKWSCYYPVRVIIFHSNNFETYETIELF